MKNKYEYLFSPLKIGGIMLKNRIETAPMSMIDFTAKDYVPHGWIEFYERLAAGGAAVVTVGETPVLRDSGITHPHMLMIADPDLMAYLSKVTDAIHRHQAHASIELCHGGAASARYYNGGKPAMGPSEGVCPFDGAAVKEMPEEDIWNVVEAFGDAAKRAQLCGFDMCMVHAGHGWLLSQFLSPINNKRTDRWGGSHGNRVRIVREIVENIKRKCGERFPVEVRISGTENCEEGYGIEDCVEFCRSLDGLADLIHVSFGTIHRPTEDGGSTLCTPSPYEKRGRNVYLAAEVKRHLKKSLVTTVGSLVMPEQMEDILRSGKADMVAAARTFLADPDFPKKAKRGREDEIRPCMRCIGCLDDDRCEPHIIRCAVNPQVGRETVYETAPGSNAAGSGSQRILVVGGGPAGIQAAIEASKQGHQVILCEKSDELGGALNLSKDIPFKADMERYRQWLIGELARSEVNVLKNRTVDAEMIEKLDPDVTICAIGAEPVVPKIEGIDGGHVFQATELHRRMEEVGASVVIIGAGLIGAESAIYLAMQGRNVTLLEREDRIIPMEEPVPSDGGPSNLREYTQVNLNKQGVRQIFGVTVERIETNAVHAMDDSGNRLTFPADTVVIATGMRPLEQEREKLRAASREFVPAGDCVKVGRIKQATASGFAAGHYID